MSPEELCEIEANFKEVNLNALNFVGMRAGKTFVGKVIELVTTIPRLVAEVRRLNKLNDSTEKVLSMVGRQQIRDHEYITRLRAAMEHSKAMRKKHCCDRDSIEDPLLGTME